MALWVFLCGGEGALYDDVEFIAGLALFDDVLVGGDGDVFEDVGDLVALVWVHLFEELDLFENLFVDLSAFLRSILHNVIESQPIQRKQSRIPLTSDSRRSRRIIQQR